MKNFQCFLCLCMLLMAGDVSAQTFFESQNLVNQERFTPTVDVQVEVPAGKVNAYGWFLVGGGWGEGLVGVSKSPIPWLWVSAAAGVEANEHPFRAGSSVWVGNKQISGFFTVEYGGSGLWYKGKGFVRISQRVKLGFHSQRYYGTGPMVELAATPKTSIWVSAALSKHNSIIGIKKSF